MTALTLRPRVVTPTFRKMPAARTATTASIDAMPVTAVAINPARTITELNTSARTFWPDAISATEPGLQMRGLPTLFVSEH